LNTHEIAALCNTFRADIITALHGVQSGHPGGSLSACEILACLYFGAANVSPDNWGDPARDRVVLSKGHSAPMLYRILAEKGFFPVEEFYTIRRLGSRLQGHPSARHTPGVEVSTGPLGVGYSAAVGLALGQRLRGYNDARVYAVLGDGELNEGVIWEAVMSAAKYNLTNLITIIDHNGVQLDGTTGEIMPSGDLAAKFAAFGCAVYTCDGHDPAALIDALGRMKQAARPPVLLAKTIKGKGVSYMEGRAEWHGKPIDDEHYKLAMDELGNR